MEIAKALAVAGSIAVTEATGASGATVAIAASGKPSIAIEVPTVVIADAASIVDAPTAAVVRDVIATGRERTERPLPPERWLG